MILQIKSLIKNFGATEVIKDVSFSIDKGEIFSLIGPNGSGKTTIIKLIAGLLKPTSGQILVDGFDVVAKPLEAKSVIGYIPDEPVIWQGMSGEEFLLFSAAFYKMDETLSRRKIKKLLKIFDLTEIAKSYFEDYSRGNKQKFTILAALLHRPKLLLIDEPVVGLDPQSVQIAQKLFLDFARKGGAVLLVTHTLEVAETISTRFGFLQNGKLLKQGEKRELSLSLGLKKSANLREIYSKLVSDF